eukprot:539008_1
MTSPRRRSEGDPPLKVIENQIKNKDTQNELGGASTGKLYVFGITGDNQNEQRIDIIIEPYYTWNTEQSMVECDLTIDILDKWECKDDVYFTISMCARSSEYLGGTPIKNNDIQMSVFNSIDVSNSILFTQDMRELPIKLTFKGNVFNSKKRKTLLLKVIADSKFRNVFKPEFKSIVIVEEGYEYNPADKNLYRPSDGPRGRKAKASKAKASKAKVGRPKGSKTKGRGGGRGGGGG